MIITIIAVGKLKESYWRDACGEYVKRLGSFGKIDIIEVLDDKSDSPSSTANEGEKILKRLNPRAFKIALAIDGESKSSEAFSKDLKSLLDGGFSHISFIIGGSHGLSDEVISVCDGRLSFSEMTFPHQMMRVILLEQVYRAFKIMSKEPYHK